MLRVHSGNDSFTTSTKLKKDGVYDKSELDELESNWADVEAKKNFIVSRIDDLAKKFPTNGFEIIPENSPPALNEVAFMEVKSLRGEIKTNNEDILKGTRNYNYIINKDRKNKLDSKVIDRITNRISYVRKRTKALADEQEILKQSNSKHTDY
jgi:hypothetical protein